MTSQDAVSGSADCDLCLGPNDDLSGKTLDDLYRIWRKLEDGISAQAGAARSPGEIFELDEMTNRQASLIEQMSLLRAATLADLLIKMTVWSQSAPDVSPDCEHRQPSDSLAYSVYTDLVAVGGAEGSPSPDK